MPDLCPTCRHPHSDAVTCEEAAPQPCALCGALGEHGCKAVLEKNLRHLLKQLDKAIRDHERFSGATATMLAAWLDHTVRQNATGGPQLCRGCGATVYWITHANGKKCPYNRWGASHYGDCPKAREFSGRTV